MFLILTYYVQYQFITSYFCSCFNQNYSTVSNPIIMSEEQTKPAKQWHVTCEDPCLYNSVYVKSDHSLEDVRKFVEQHWCTTLVPDDFMFSWKGEKIGKQLEPFVKVYKLASKNVQGLKIIEADGSMNNDYIIPRDLEAHISVWDLSEGREIVVTSDGKLVFREI